MILDELLALAPHVRVVTIDTGVLFEQARSTWRAFEDHFGLRVEVEKFHTSSRPTRKRPGGRR